MYLGSWRSPFLDRPALAAPLVAPSRCLAVAGKDPAGILCGVDSRCRSPKSPRLLQAHGYPLEQTVMVSPGECRTQERRGHRQIGLRQQRTYRMNVSDAWTLNRPYPPACDACSHPTIERRVSGWVCYSAGEPAEPCGRLGICALHP